MGMSSVRQDSARPRLKWSGMLENVFIIILAFYPLRHIRWGLDLWDTGYNYANFQYIGTEHMDPMWLFSTYLANVAGNLLTKLPAAGTLQGMNLYTGLFVSVLALTGYFFCTRKLKLPAGLSFLGEMTAISLCWCPTAVLYNYLTYVFFLFSSIFLYLGLTKESRIRLFLAGVFLGMNVLVRFSNLPQAAMILAVWAYDVIVWLEEKKKAKERGGLERRQARFWPRLLQHTLWCFLGYMAALAVLYLVIAVRYGMGEYVEGIARLFAMTETASDYKATAMVRKMLDNYVKDLYWIIRLLVIMAGGMIMFAAAGWLEGRLRGQRDKGESAGRGVRRQSDVLELSGGFGAERGGAADIAARALHTGIRILWILVSIATAGWLYYRGFCNFDFYSYDSIWYPGPSFLLLTMAVAAVRIFFAKAPKEEKLISGMVMLVILLTSIGSNNGILPSLNNLFLAAPYTLWECWRFVRCVGDKRTEGGLVCSSFPAKGILIVLLAICLSQFGCFGVKFVFAEATGVQEASAAVEEMIRATRMCGMDDGTLRIC